MNEQDMKIETLYLMLQTLLDEIEEITVERKKIVTGQRAR